MKRFYFLSTLVLTLLACSSAIAQDFSNKGKDFYLCFPQHVPSGNSFATLSIYITSDKASSGTISMPNGAFSATFNILANGIQTISIPWNSNIHITNTESSNELVTQILKKSIHIKVDPGKPPVVAYAQQWAGARSCATLVLPTTVLGKKYYAISFTQTGSNANPYLARSQFQVIAVKDNTTIKITPRKNGIVGTAFTITLPLAGDMIQYQSPDGAAMTQDLSGTLIESVASASGGCVPIAVFSGSSNVTMGSPTCSGGSYDPLWQQCYPVSTWGKSFGFIPFADYPAGVPYRVLASEDNTGVYFDGLLVAVLNAGQIYPSVFTQNPVLTFNPINIKTDKPVCVTEYAQAQVCANNGNTVGDPDMVILNPIEQNISDITIFSSILQSITRQWVNVLMKTTGTANFKISKNGGPLNPPVGTWAPFPTMPGYSYLRESLIGVSSARLVADSGFNATAYGFGNVESYAYSAGTNVKDLYNQIGFVNPYGEATSPNVCKGIASRFRISLPYLPDSMYWDFHGFQTPNVNVIAPVPDSTTSVNGRPVYWFSLPTPYFYNLVGTFPVTITTYTPNSDGCGSQQDIDFDVTVYDLPIADFNFNTSGCVTSPVTFTDNTNTNGRPILSWHWNFGDGGTAATQNTSHTYAASGSYNVKHSVITDIGCKADTVIKVVTLGDPPTANFTTSSPDCPNVSIQFTDASTVPGGGTINQWNWDFGDGGTSTMRNPTHTYTTAGVYTVVLRVTTTTGCQSLPYSFQITIHTKPASDFSFPILCLPNTVPFTDLSTITGAGETVSDWAWDFGDGGTSTAQNPSHPYLGGGPYNVTLVVTSNNGCTDSKTQVVNSAGATPTAAFSVPAAACNNSTVTFTDISSVPGGGAIASWNWNFGDPASGTNNTSIFPNPTHIFSGPGTYTVTLSVGSAAGCQSAAPASHQITINALPAPTLSGPTSTCLNSVGNVYTTQTGNTNYIWTVVGGTITAGGTSTSNTATITWTSIGAQSVSVNYTDANGCTAASATVFNVTVNSLPTATITAGGPITFCTGGSVTLTASAGISWLWSTGATTQSITVSASGSYSVTVTNGNGCSATSATTTVTANALPMPTLSGSTSVCLNSAGNVYTTQAGRINYIWTVVGGTITAGGTSTSNAATVTWTNTGTQSISVNYTDANGCTAASATVFNVNVNPLPTPTINGPASACLNSVGNVYTTQAGNTNYIWTVIGGTITAGGTSASNTATVTWTSAGPQSISVNYTDANGCTAASATVFNVTVGALPTATISASGPITFCAGGSVTLTASAGTSWLWSNGATTQSITVATSGTYTVTVTISNGCSATSNATTITVNALPTPSLSGPTSACLNSSGNIYTTQAGKTNYIWNVVGGTITAGGTSTSNTATITWTNTGTQSISTNYTDANGCTAASATVFNVTVNALPTPTLNGPTSICLNSAGNVYITQAGNTNYIWTIVGGTITAGGTSTSNTATVTWTSTGAQSISVNYTDANGCTATLTTVFNVTVNALPTPTLNGPTSICFNSVGNVYTTEAGKANYIWSVVGGTITAGGTSTSNTATVTWTNAGAQSISVNYADANGCTAASATVFNVTVNALPAPTLSGPISVCLNSAGNIYTTQAGKTNYIWNIVGGTITAGGTSTSNTATVTWPNTGPQSISVNYTDANGCTAASTTVFNVTVKPLPNATITGNSEACLNSTPPSITFTGANGTTPYTFIYKINGGSNQTITTSSGNSVTVLVPTGIAGTYTYSLVSVQEGSTNACIQAQAGSVSVTINPLPTAGFTTSVPSCETNNIMFTDASLANAGSLTKWTWDYGDGNSAVFMTGVPFNHVYANAGTYNVTLVVETNKGCVSTVLTKQVIVNVRPKAEFTAPQICVSDPVAPFTDASQISAGSVTAWKWSFDDGGTSTAQNPSHPFATPGTHSATLISVSNQGCTDTITHTFTVNGAPTANFAVQNINTLCSNQTVNITDGSSVTSGNIIRTEIYWDYNNDPTIKTVDNSPVIGTSYTHAYPEFGTPATKTVAVRYVTYSGITCLSSFTRNVTLLATPTLQFDAVTPVCSDAPSFQITTAQILNALPGTGVFSGTGVSSTGFFNTGAAGAGAHTIRYTFNATNGCSNYIEQVVNVNPTPVINAGPDKVVLEGGVVQLTPSVTIGGPPITYLWTPSSGLSDPTNPYTNASPTADITYTLTVTSDKGCTASDQVFVKLLKAPVIPNIFSPNGDGIHDKWVIAYLETYPGCTVDIYNRYGQLIYHSVGYSNPWDGTAHGQPVPVGTYYYIVNPKNGRKLMSGYVDVIR